MIEDKLGHHGAAMAWYDAAAAAIPRDPEPYVMGGQSALARGEFEEADRRMSAALSVSPANYLALTGLAIARHEEGRTREAIVLLERANALVRDCANEVRLAAWYSEIGEAAIRPSSVGAHGPCP